MIVCLKFPEKLLTKVLELESEVILIRDEYDVANEPVSDKTRSRLHAIYEIGRLDSIEEMSAVFVDLSLKYSREIEAVLAGAEYGIFGASYLRTALGIDPREPDLGITARDKRWMKKAFADADIPCARIISDYQPGDPIPDDIFPVVAKPATGTGSFNTAILNTPAELEAFVTTEQLHPALVSHRWAVEQKIEGEEYHVDMVWQNGQIVFSSVGRYLVPRLDALKIPSRNGSIILSPIDNSDLYETFGELMKRFGTAKRLSSGVTHAEFFVDTAGNTYISEVATRFAGGAVPDAIYAAFGVDIIEAWMRAELGLELNLNVHPEKNKVTGWIHVSPDRDGEISALPTAEEYLNSDGVIDVKIATTLGQTYRHDNPSNWCVMATIIAPDEQSFIACCDNLYEKLPVLV